MIQALNDYLKGDHSYRWGLDPACRLAFEFLRQEIDKAIERSRKARERAALRRSRKAESVAESVTEGVAAAPHDNGAESQDVMRKVMPDTEGRPTVDDTGSGCRDDGQSGLLRSTDRSARRERTCISVGV